MINNASCRKERSAISDVFRLRKGQGSRVSINSALHFVVFCLQIPMVPSYAFSDKLTRHALFLELRQAVEETENSQTSMKGAADELSEVVAKYKHNLDKGTISKLLNAVKP